MESIPHTKPPWDDGSGPNYSSPYQDLATAIVQLAVKDYKKTLRAIWKTPKSEYKRRKLIAQKAELEEFFYSDDYVATNKGALLAPDGRQDHPRRQSGPAVDGGKCCG